MMHYAPAYGGGGDSTYQAVLSWYPLWWLYGLVEGSVCSLWRYLPGSVIMVPPLVTVWTS